MVCKEDVITWFKEAASYRRVDVMCTLLNMCLPFELRYLGSCIEELGKHDFQELRGATLTANSVEKLSKDFSASKSLFDKCVRHRLTLYLTLLQSRNYTCANWIYELLLRTDDSVESYLANNRFNNFSNDVDLNSELVLLFTLALNHPAFTFEQKRYFGEVVTRLESVSLGPVPPPHNLPPCPPGLGYNIKPPLPVHHLPPIGMAKAPGGVPHSETPLPPPGIPLPAVHAGDFTPPGMWSRSHFINTSCPPPQPPDLAAFPPPISPLVSQQSSPTPSRNVSPTRMYSCRPHPPPLPTLVPHMDRLPPPPLPSGKDPVLAPQFNTDLKTIPMEEVLGDVNEKNPQQQWLESMILGSKLVNGLIPGAIPGPPPKCQTVYLTNDIQSLNLDGDASSSASSNSSESHSPPVTPTDGQPLPLPHGPGRGLLSDPGKMRNGNNPPPGLPELSTAPVVGSNPALFTNCSVPYTSHFPVPCPPGPPINTFHNRSFLYTQAYRPQFAAYQQNGEIPYLFPPYLHMMYSSAVPPPKISCYNCGLQSHPGADCKEPSIEEVTQKTGYQLDYTTPPPDAPPSDK